MSRDQRPARVKLVGSAPTVPPARRSDDIAKPGKSGKPTSESAAPRSSGLLYGATFLIACLAGAVGMALLPILGLR